MVLDFGLNITKSTSRVSHSISSTHLKSLKSKQKKEKKRQASSADYCGTSSSEDESYTSDSDSGDEDFCSFGYNNIHSNSKGYNGDPHLRSKKSSNYTSGNCDNDRKHSSHRSKHDYDATRATRDQMSYNPTIGATPAQGASASAALAAMLNIEYCENEIAADHNLKLAADLEAELYHDQPQQGAVTEESGDEYEEDEEEESEDFLESLDEVHTRFLLNVPPEELSTSERIFFQLEQAWWYYEDLICDQLEEELGSCPLPRFANLKPFSRRLFEFSPLLRDLDFDALWREFATYKRKISSYGCILLNKACTHLVLCKLYKSNVWTFPAGKINQNEIGIEAAARETYEETGFDPHCNSGLTALWKTQNPQGITWQHPLSDPENALAFVEQPSGKRRTCYVCPGVPEDFPFEPVCRKEVDNIEWIDLRDVKEYKSFAVLPFLGKLKKWIKRRSNGSAYTTKEKKTKKKKERKNNKSRPKSRPKSRDKSNARDKSSSRQRSSRKKGREQLVDAGLMASMGDSTRWTAEEMFAANSKLQGGRIVEYDGNPHEFAEKGFGIDDQATGQKRVDPHSFRVVGGSFMNSQHGDQLADVGANAGAKYQPLVRNRKDDDEDDDGLQPFFSQHGATPWGDVVEGVQSDDDDDAQSFADDDDLATDSGRASQDLLSIIQKGSSTKAEKSSRSKSEKQQQSKQQKPVSGEYDYDNSDNDDEFMIFATDKEITAKRQRDHERQHKKEQERQRGLTASSSSRANRHEERRQQLLTQYEKDMAFVHQWVENLSNPVNFKIPDVDAIIDQHFGSIPKVSKAKTTSNGSGETSSKPRRSGRPSGREKEKRAVQ
eukprot:jgi/Psemu1/68588/estExt_Genemark1.C_5340021